MTCDHIWRIPKPFELGVLFGSGDSNPAAAGGTAAVLTDTTFTGGAGSTAYTVGQLVGALKTNVAHA